MWDALGLPYQALKSSFELFSNESRVEMNVQNTERASCKQSTSAGGAEVHLACKFQLYSFKTLERVGHEFGSNFSTSLGSKGTQILPVFG